jgi:glycerol uptake facilitator-like aquaporin
MLAKFLAEMAGTFILLTVTITLSNGYKTFKTYTDWIKIGLALSISIVAFGFISGGHFSALVSTIFFLDDRLTFPELLIYISGQITGMLLAFCYYKYTKKYL